jgi:glutamine---fructose-6-phosphate transaminase (isomerizing)
MFNLLRKTFNYTGVIGIFAGILLNQQDYLKNLGIMGYIGREPKAIRVILDGLDQIQNEGYTAAGVATLHETNARITKYANTTEVSSLERLRKEALFTHEGSYIGIGHTHISKSGSKIDSKAHPHSDHNNRIFVAHNGSITNSNELLNFILTKGINPKTDSHTEILAILIGLFLDDGHPLKVATRLALEKTAGTWGLVVIDKLNPDQLIAAQHGSSLYVSINDQDLTISSDKNVLKSGKIIKLEDGYVYALDSKNKVIESNKIKDLGSLLSLGEFPHWTIKEIEEQPQSIARAINYGARLTTDSAKLKGLEEIKDSFLSVKNLAIMGCGSSFHACQFGSHIIKYLNLMDTVIPMDPSGSYTTLPYASPGAILISESGETPEIVEIAQKCLSQSIPTISIVNVVASKLANLTGHGVYMNAGQEIAEAATKSFVTSCVVLTEVALWISHFRKPENTDYCKKLVNSLITLPMMCGSVIARSKEEVKSLANELKKEEHMFVLGRGMGESIACEGALIIKQLARVHAEGYAGGALKHGPFALIGDGTPIILIILDDEHQEMMNLALAEVQARNAKTIVITPNKNLITTKKSPDKVLLIEENGPLTGLLAVIPLQLLAYHLSIQRELDPDYPISSEVLISLD